MKFSWPVWPTSRSMASRSVAPGSSTTTRSVPWTTTIGSDTPVELTRRSMMSRIVFMAAASGTLLADRQRPVLHPQTALEVEPELGLEDLCAGLRVAQRGKLQTGPKVDREREDADDHDEQGGEATHRGGLYQSRAPEAEGA